MQNRVNPAFNKRKKELARQEKQKRKIERKHVREREKQNEGGEPVEDPDIAGIVPGPQPPATEE